MDALSFYMGPRDFCEVVKLMKGVKDVKPEDLIISMKARNAMEQYCKDFSCTERLPKYDKELNGYSFRVVERSMA